MSGNQLQSTASIQRQQSSIGATPAAAVIEYILDDSTEEKLKDLFELYDADGNGMIQRDELFNVLALCAHDIGLEMDSYLEQIVETIFSSAQLNTSGSITYEGLRDVLRKRPNLIFELSLCKSCHDLTRATSSYKTASSAASSTRSLLSNSAASNNSSGYADSNYYSGLLGPTGQCQPQLGFGQRAAIAWDALVCQLGQHFAICNKLRTEYVSNNLVRFNFFLFLVLTSLGLIIGRIVTYWNHCGFLILARASGQCLNFLCSIVVLLVCRRSISLLRSKGFGRYLPLDDHVYFHKMIGLFIVGHSLAHAFGHVLNFRLVSLEDNPKYTWLEYLFSTHTGIGWIGGCASLTGWLLLLIILIMASAQPFSRSLGKFELFYYTHLLYILFWALLFVHASHFWIWFVGPFTVFVVESIIRLRNLLTNLTSTGRSTIIKAVPLPSNVIHLVIKRPQNFDYKPGDWIYVLIPQIAKYEWHPFTISSAPEQDGVIWLHIRAVGEWTRCLRSYFEAVGNRNHLSRFIRSGQFSMSMDNYNLPDDDLSSHDSASILGSGKLTKKHLPLSTIHENISIDLLDNNNKTPSDGESIATIESSDQSRATATTTTMPNITIFIDGPYGSPSGQIFQSEHAVLIATGIGVTPFASILQSIVHHYEKRRQKCPSCACEFSDMRPPFVCKLRKVDFVWINRDQKSFEWFIKLLAELELTQSHLAPSERFLDIHIHLTAMEPAKTKTVGLQLALYLIHEKNKKDLVTGLRTRTKAGRPNWDEFFTYIQDQKKGKVSVFFCGRPQLSRLLHRKCDSFGFKFRKEIF